MRTAVIIVDHGSRREESNRLLVELCRVFSERFNDKYAMVEPAHMELAEPSIATAYRRCAERGAQRVIVAPYFLGPGKHWTSDIPRLAAEAAARFPETVYHVSPTLGIDDLMLDLLDKRISGCVRNDFACETCRDRPPTGECGAARL